MIKNFTALALSLAALFALPSASDGQTRRTPAPAAATVAATPEGGFRMGSATARVRLVEYVSYTCPHCATYDAQAGPVLRDYVGRGTTSVEVRPMVRDGIDLVSAILARCGAPARFFDRHHALMARQAETMAAVGRAQPGWAALPPAQLEPGLLYPRVAREVGLTAAVAPFGVTAAQANICLTDRPAIERIFATSEAGSALGIEGTPSFLINGELQRGAHSWAAVRTRLDAALAAR